MQPRTLWQAHTYTREEHTRAYPHKQEQKRSHTSTHAQNTCAIRDLAPAMAPTYAAICVTVETDELPILLLLGIFFFFLDFFLVLVF